MDNETTNRPTAEELREDNNKLRAALIAIRKHVEEIDAILAELGDLVTADGDQPAEEAAPEAATDEDIKELLKKYSRL